MKKHNKVVLVRWDRLSENKGWRGEVVSGDVPRKIVFIDGAKWGRPLGVEPKEGEVFLSKITGELFPDERRGVLFAHPLRLARMGWVPTEEKIKNARLHKWACIEKGFEGRSLQSNLQKPTTEPKENDLFRELQMKKLMIQKSHTAYGASLPELIVACGKPDKLKVYACNVVFEWIDLGEARVNIETLIKGLNSLPCPSGVDPVFWQKITAPWPIEFISLTKEIEDGLDGPTLRAKGHFRFRDFPELKFRSQVYSMWDQMIYKDDFFFSFLPKDLQEEIDADLRKKVPDPAEGARKYFGDVDDLMESARNLALFRLAEKSISQKAIHESVWIRESPDGYRRGGYSDKKWVTYTTLFWSIEGKYIDRFSFKGAITLEEAIRLQEQSLLEDYKFKSKLTMGDRILHPYADYVAAEKKEEWVRVYFAELKKLKEDALKMAESILRGNV